MRGGKDGGGSSFCCDTSSMRWALFFRLDSQSLSEVGRDDNTDADERIAPRPGLRDRSFWRVTPRRFQNAICLQRTSCCLLHSRTFS